MLKGRQSVGDEKEHTKMWELKWQGKVKVSFKTFSSQRFDTKATCKKVINDAGVLVYWKLVL